MDNEGSTAGGKVRTPKNHSTAKPYDRRKTLFGKVGDTVKEMLSPSWLVDIVSSVKKKSTDNSQTNTTENREGHGLSTIGKLNLTTSSDQQINFSGGNATFTMTDRPNVERPSMIRSESLPYTHSNQIPYAMYPGPPPPPFNHFGPPPDGYVPGAPMPPHSFHPHPPPGFYGPPPSLRPPSPGNLVNGGDDHSETSSPGSMIPHPDRNAYQQQELMMHETRLSPAADFHISKQHAHSENIFASLRKVFKRKGVKKESGLWSSQRGTTPPPAKKHKPAFNLAVFCTKSKSDEKPGIFGKSPYYSGKTAFGGAASANKVKASPSPYQVNPSRRQVQAKTRLEAGSNSSTSTTAKWILNTLERMSTPLSDSKKIPTYNQSMTEASLAMTPGTYRRRSRDTSQLAKGPPKDRLTTPRIVKHEDHKPLISKKIEMSNIAEPQIRNLQNPTTGASLSTGMSTRTGKMRREKASQHYSSKRDADDEEPEEVNLPNDVKLSVGKLPAFNFTDVSSFVKPSTSVETSNSLGDSLSSSSSSNQKFPSASTLEKSEPFTFSSPIVKQVPTISTAPCSPQNFLFSSPINMNKDNSSQSPEETKIMFSSSSSTPKLKEIHLTKDHNIAPKLATTLNTTGSVLNALQCDKKQPVSTLKTGSVMDVLSKKEANNNKPSLNTMFKKAAGSWECSSCMIQNKSEHSKCVACESSKPDSKPAPLTNVPEIKSSWGGTFNKPSGQWDCDACLVRNEADKKKCVACETPNPKNKTIPATSVSLGMSVDSGSSWGNNFTKAADTWECSTCMIQNKSAAQKCAACETPKPVEKITTSTPQPAVVNKWGDMFKKSAGWDCSVCMIHNKDDHLKCVACETAKPSTKANSSSVTSKEIPQMTGSPLKMAKASGSWECDTCMVQNKSDAPKCIACETPKPGGNLKTGFTNSGGFKFETPVSSSSQNSVFGSKMSTSAPSGGFQMTASPSVNTTSSTSGFKITPMDKNKPLSGGFKMPVESSTATPGGFKVSGSSTTPTSGGFKLPDAASKPPSSGGFQLSGGSKLPDTATGENKLPDTSESLKLSNSFAPSTGGFKFSAPAAKTENLSTIPAENKNNDKAIAKPSDTLDGNGKTPLQVSTDTTNANSGFTFGAPKTTVPSVGDTASEPPKTDDKPKTLGGFSFGMAVTSKPEENKTAVTGFNFSANKPANTVAPKSGMGTNATVTFGGFGTDAVLSADNKSKPTASTTPFTFGAASKVTQSTAPQPGGFAFNSGPSSVDPAVSAPSTTAFGSGGFNFGGSVAATSKPVSTGLGSVPTNQTTFAFGGTGAKSGETANFTFGQTSTVTASNSPFTFGKNTTQSEHSPRKRGLFESDDPATKKSTFTFGDSSKTATGVFKFGQQDNNPQTGPNPFSSPAGSSKAPLGTSSGKEATNMFAPVGNQPAFAGFGVPPAPNGSPGIGRSASVPSFGNISTNPFGASNSIQAQPNKGFNFSAAGTTGGFNFTANSATSQNSNNSGNSINFAASSSGAPAINFSASAAKTAANPFSTQPSSNPFNASGNSHSSNRRPVKKAVRKLRGR